MEKAISETKLNQRVIASNKTTRVLKHIHRIPSARGGYVQKALPMTNSPHPIVNVLTINKRYQGDAILRILP